MTDTDDLVALRQLVDRYAEALDNRSADRLVTLFTPDATLTSFRPNRPEPFFVLAGTAEIGTLLERLERYSQTFHFVGNHLVTLNGDSAIGEVYCLAHHLAEDEDGQFARVAAVRYTDRYARGAEGWRFTARVIRRVWMERRPALYVDAD